MLNRTVAGALAVVLAVSVSAAPIAAPRWGLPREDAEKWAARIRKLARDGWTVSVRGNDVVLERDKPVRFARALPNEPHVLGPERIPDLTEAPFRLTLRFAPLVSVDEYERLAAINAGSERERDRLKRAVGVPHKFDEFVATTPTEKERVREYREAIKKLPHYDLPDLYVLDYSIYLLRSQDGWSYVYDKNVAAECHDVEQTLLRYFGMYHPAAAAGGQGIGRTDSPK